MKSNPLPVLLLACALMAGVQSRTWAEDWKTSDGKVYEQVTVVKIEPDAVTVIYKQGGALIPLAQLPPDLQKRFNYDPAKASVAAAARAKSDEANAAALKAEAVEAQKKAAREAAAYKAQMSPPPAPTKPDDTLHTQQFLSHTSDGDGRKQYSTAPETTPNGDAGFHQK